MPNQRENKDKKKNEPKTPRRPMRRPDSLPGTSTGTTPDPLRPGHDMDREPERRGPNRHDIEREIPGRNQK